MSDLDQFRDTYLNESFERLEDMESRLMQLDLAQPGPEDYHATFRCAHSIKGGGGAFGFDEIVSLTHNLENLLDDVRNDQHTMILEMPDSPETLSKNSMRARAQSISLSELRNQLIQQFSKQPELHTWVEECLETATRSNAQAMKMTLSNCPNLSTRQSTETQPLPHRDIYGYHPEPA